MELSGIQFPMVPLMLHTG